MLSFVVLVCFSFRFSSPTRCCLICCLTLSWIIRFEQILCSPFLGEFYHFWGLLILLWHLRFLDLSRDHLFNALPHNSRKSCPRETSDPFQFLRSGRYASSRFGFYDLSVDVFMSFLSAHNNSKALVSDPLTVLDMQPHENHLLHWKSDTRFIERVSTLIKTISAASSSYVPSALVL